MRSGEQRGREREREGEKDEWNSVLLFTAVAQHLFFKAEKKAGAKRENRERERERERGERRAVGKQREIEDVCTRVRDRHPKRRVTQG